MPLFAAVLFVTHGFVGDTEKWSREIPEPLRKAFEYRMKPRTGYLRFTRDYQAGSVNPKMTFTTDARFAGGNIFIDEDSAGGILMVMPGDSAKRMAEKNTPHYRRARVVDYEKSQTIARNEGQNDARLNKIDNIYKFEVRSLGLNWGIRHDQSPTEILNDLTTQAKAKFSVEKRGELIEVRAKYDSQSENETTWIIDPAKGLSISMIEHRYAHADGSGSSSCVCKVENEFVDGYWWPKHIESTCDESGFHETIDMVSMEFDRSSHPDKINLDALNLPIGAKISEQVGYGQDAFFRQYQYTGNDQMVRIEDWKPPGRIVSRKPMDFESMKKRATTRPDGTWVVENPDLVPKVVPAPKINTAADPDEWEAHVRRWIALRDNSNERVKVKFPLDEKQKNAAMAILQESRLPAWNLIKRRQKELEVIRQRLEEKESSQQGKKPDLESEAAIDSLKVRIEELDLPDPEVEAIFGRLKSRLNDLLTAQQRDSSNFIGNQARSRTTTSQPTQP